MYEEKVVDAALEVAVDAGKKVATPSAESAGEILSFIPRSIRVLMMGWEKWIINGEESMKYAAQSIREKAQHIPQEKYIEPEPHIVIPAIQQLSYCQNSDELRDLYANLLVSSMNTDKKWQVHPAFVDIIKQITPDEAKILKSLPPQSITYYPLIDLRLVSTERGKGGSTLLSNFTTVGLDKVENVNNICSYIENLERLKLIELPPTMAMTDKSNYDTLKNHPILKRHIPVTLHNTRKIDYTYKVFNVTNFGALFIKTCCR